MTVFRPHSYQAKAIEWALDRPTCGLFLPMGAGKTVSTLSVISELLMFDVKKVLIIGPKRVVESTWPDEIQKWDHTRFLTWALITAPMAKGREPIPSGKDIYLVSKDNVTDLIERLDQRWPFELVVIDELSTFKSPKAKRFKALRRVMPATKRFIGLTGTPAPKGIPDLWAQIYLMDQGERLGKTQRIFQARYLYPARMNAHVVYDWGVKDGAQEQIYDTVGDICMSIKQSECADLPPVAYIDRLIDLGVALQKYKTFKREKILEVCQGQMDDAIMAANAGVLTLFLSEFASGQIYTSDHKDVHTLHDMKLLELEDLMTSANGQPVMVFYYFKHEADRIRNHFEKQYSVRALDTHQDIEDWNVGKIDMLLVHPASAGHGLNLQKGGHIGVWYSLPNWNLELYQQANARIYRQGQKEPVVIYHILAKGTIDEDMLRALQSKEVTQRTLLDALRR